MTYPRNLNLVERIEIFEDMIGIHIRSFDALTKNESLKKNRIKTKYWYSSPNV